MITYKESKELDQLSAMFLGSKSAWKKYAEKGVLTKIESTNGIPTFEMKKEDPSKLLSELRNLKVRVDADRVKKQEEEAAKDAALSATGSL